MFLDVVRLFDVVGERKEFSFTLDLSDCAVDGVFPYAEPIVVTGVAENRAGIVTLRMHADYTMCLLCDRCLSEFNRVFAYDFEHTLVPELNGEDDETFVVVEGTRLDIAELVRADILLQLPSKILCDEECRGLCHACGQNLNLGECVCGG